SAAKDRLDMRNSLDPGSATFVSQQKVLELQLLVAVARIREELLEQFADQARLDAVVIVLAVTPVADQPGHAQQGQVMAHGRLGLLEQVAQRGDVQLAILGQGQQDFEARFVGQELEDLRQSVDSSFGDFDDRSTLG